MSQRDKDGNTPVDIVYNLGLKSLQPGHLRLLWQLKPGKSPLHQEFFARRFGSAEEELLYPDTPEPDCGLNFSWEGETLLQIIALTGKISPHRTGNLPLDEEFFNEAIEMGADINARDAAGRTPLHLAAFSANSDLVGVLLKVGAQLDVVDNEASSPWYYARRGQYLWEKTTYSAASSFPHHMHAMCSRGYLGFDKVIEILVKAKAERQTTLG